MYGMFSNADLFNSPVYRWDVSNVTTFQNMFQNCYKFEQEVRTWNVNSDKTLTNIFANIAGNDRPFGNKYLILVLLLHHQVYFGIYILDSILMEIK